MLRGFTFSTGVQTEDIDVSARAMLHNHNIAFCAESRSGELCPSDLGALYRQRLRWAIGWDQVTLSSLTLTLTLTLSLTRTRTLTLTLTLTLTR